MRICLHLTIVAILILTQEIKAQTFISGFLTTSLTWTISGSPYIVTGNALLTFGNTLTIDPGVVVKFDLNKALQIDGQMIAIGTSSQRITFTSNQSSPQPGDWAKLHFSDSCTDAMFDANGNYVSGTIMKYCNVSYAGGIGFGAIHVQQSSPYINHCRIESSAAAGIDFTGDSVTIDSCVIRDCATFAIDFQIAHYLLRRDSIINNGNGIRVAHWHDGRQSYILDSYFERNTMALFPNNMVSSDLARTTISGNTFYDNSWNVLTLQGMYDTVTCNKFLYNSGGAGIFWGDAAGLIYNNVFEGNSSSDKQSVVTILGVYYDDTLIFANNLVRFNTATDTSCILFIPCLDSICQENLRVYDNSFTENSGKYLMEVYGVQNNDPAVDPMYVYHNIFINPGCSYELFDNIPYGAPNLALNNNYWGTTNTAHIDSVIYDYFDFANLSVVYYMPILTSPATFDTTCQPFVSPPLSIGENYTAASSLTIYPNPTPGVFSIGCDHCAQPILGTLEIYNSLAELVYSTSVSGFPIINITLPESAGMYLVKVTTDNYCWMGRIVKQ